MTELSNTILKKYQTRKRESQKIEFINFLFSKLAENKIAAKVEESGRLIKNRNIVIGNLSESNIIFTAHYDTAPKLFFPNFITPKNILLYVLYQLLILFPLFLLTAFVSFAAVSIFDSVLLSYIMCMIIALGFVYLIMFGKENNNTANDNTSGVITLCEIMLNMTDEERRKAAFVFFDNEEIGLVGSAAFAKKHKSEIKNKVVVNFDCVSDGDNIMFAVNKAASEKYSEQIEAAYNSNHNYNVKPFVTKAVTTVYPSDQMNFPVNISVAALKHKKFIGYYVDKIHTKNDTAFREENIKYLTASSVKFADYVITKEKSLK